MRVIWEPKDIVPGRLVKRPGTNEAWMIGYLPNMQPPGGYVLISMSDGMITGDPCRAAKMCEILNQGDLPVELLDFPKRGLESN